MHGRRMEEVDGHLTSNAAWVSVESARSQHWHFGAGNLLTGGPSPVCLCRVGCGHLIGDLLSGPSADVRLAAARALDDVPQSPDVERALIQARRHDPDPQIRKWALHALGCAHCKPNGVCSSDVVGEFTDALVNDRSGIVRKFAAGMMMHGQLGLDARVFAAFETVRQHPQRILRERAEYFLARHSQPVT